MKEIIFGTINPAKVSQARDVLEPLGVRVKSLAGFEALTIIEDGETAEENARKKAITYAQKLQRPVLTMDAGLYFDTLPQSEQPGLYVRRIAGKERATDQEMLAYYTKLVAGLGKEVEAYWHYAYALGWPDGKCLSFTYDTPRLWVSKPSSTIIEGYPLEALQIDPETRQYVSEMSPRQTAEFWRKSIGVALAQFIREHFDKI